ncbi:FUSC family protein [Listeria sp. FSL L7-1582]|uniref:FUSC family protein n=1 Tax=Listeria portnoyi TaxID=2713504 RepID=UPI00164D9A2D|nr:FUSC family protein [Listeria portnoyi]MBC6309944.1 FUSC family protein [Listeria portnoyi]
MKTTLRERLALDPRVAKVLISLLICIFLYPFFGTYIVYPTYVFNAIYVTAQLTKGATYKSSMERVLGTIVGGATGILFYFIVPDHHFLMIPIAATIAVLWGYLFVGKFTPVIAVITVMILVGKGEGQPVLYINNRIIDTLIGLAIGLLIYSLYPKKKTEMNRIFYDHAKACLTQIDKIRAKYQKKEAMHDDLVGAWKALQALKEERMRIVNDSSFVPKVEEAEPMLSLIHDLEQMLRNLEVLYHHPVSDDTNAELAAVIPYHEQAFDALDERVRQKIGVR